MGPTIYVCLFLVMAGTIAAFAPRKKPEMDTPTEQPPNNEEARGIISNTADLNITNITPHKLEAINVYFASGTSDMNVPSPIESGEAGAYSARSLTLIVSGAAGVLAYHIEELDITLAIMYSVPYNRVLYENWWNAKIFGGEVEADRHMFDDLYSRRSDPFKGDNQTHEKDLGADLFVFGRMSSSGEAILDMTLGKYQ